MLRLIRQAALNCIAESGIPRFVHRSRTPDSLSIVMYHAVTDRPLRVPNWCFLPLTKFRGQMKYLRDHFDVLPLPEAVDRLNSRGLSRPTAAITLDDGYQNNHDLVFPILREYGLPATIFLNTAFTGTEQTPWFCRLHAAIEKTGSNSLDWHGGRFDLSSTCSRAGASAYIQSRLKKLRTDRLREETERIILQLGCHPEAPLDPGSPYRMLDSGSIRTMAKSDWVEFGAHILNHAIISSLDSERADNEIRLSVESTAELSGHPCRCFAYPNGQPGDYSPDNLDSLANTAYVTP